MSTAKRYKVIDGPVGIRKDVDGERLTDRLSQGEEFEALADPVDKGGYLWAKHSKGWSAISNSDGDEVFMLDISGRDPNAPRTFRVWAASISVRSEPNGPRLPEKLFGKAEVVVDPKSRTEAGGYIWWKHDKGWSAECSTNGKEIFMKEVFDSAATAAASFGKKVALGAYFKGKVAVQLAQGTKVRDKPSLDTRGLVIVNLKKGKSLEIDADNIVEADGYYWARHDLGWSAIQSIDGKTVFMAEPGTIPGLIYIGPDGPKAEELPGYRSLITRLPVDLADTQWFQYFGNNMWAFTKGKDYGYDRYSQAMHGGLDFGNSLKAGIKIYAGIEGEYIKTEYPKKNNARIFIKSGDYTFIYQHITSIQGFAPNQKITPDTLLASIEHNSIDNGWDHLHFEVRYLDEWIINPLLLMTDAVYQQIAGRFDPNKANETYKKIDSLSNFFYKSATWTKWCTPLDQPMIKLTGECIGPRYEKADAPADI